GPSLDRGRRDTTALGGVHEFGIGHRVAARGPAIELLDDGEHHQPDHEPDADVLEQIVQTKLLADPSSQRMALGQDADPTTDAGGQKLDFTANSPASRARKPKP